MKHRRLVALTALAAVAFTGGCGAAGSAAANGAPDIAATAAPTSVASSESSASVKDEGNLPDPCTLLSKAEVTDLTGRDVTQIDEDGGGDGTRYCQWQQSGGQLAVFLSRTTGEDFEVTIAEAEWVDGVGQDAYQHSGHLYVLYGTVQLDIYSRGESDEQNLTDAKEVAQTLIPRI